MQKITIYKIRPLMIYLVILLFAASCIKDNFDMDRLSEKVSYRPSFIIPLASGSMTLGNLLEPDDSLIFFEPDNSIRILVKEDSIFSLSVKDFLEVPGIEPVSVKFMMDPVPLDGFSSYATISLGDLTAPGNMNEPAASAINSSAGSTSVFPGVPLQYMGVFPSDDLQDIDYAGFTAGEVQMKVKNNLPVEVSLEIDLVNDYDGSHIGSFIIAGLGAGQELSHTAPLAGKLVRSIINLDIVSFSSPGSGDEEIYIDMNDALEIEIVSNSLLADKARARIPVQILDDGSEIRPMEFRDDEFIESLSLESGNINYTIPNNSGGLSLNVDLLNASRQGEPYGFIIRPDGTGGMINDEIAFSDIDIAFSSPDHNLIIDYALVLGSEHGFTEFDFSEGEYDFYMDFSELVPGAVRGYLGQESFVIDDEVFEIDFDFFQKVSGDFRLTNPSVRLFYENSVGVPIKLLMNVHGESAANTTTMSLLDESHEGFLIEFPTEPGISTPGEIVLNRETSNIVDFISLPPSKFTISGSTEINPGGKSSVPNFIDSRSSFVMGMEIDMPLEMQLTDFILSDTVAIDIKPDDLDMIEKLIMTIEVANKFPLGVNLDISLYDSISDRILYTLDNIILANAASVDELGIVVPGSVTVSETAIEVSADVIDHMKVAGHIIIKAGMNTGTFNNQSVPVKFRTTDMLDFRIRMKADLNIE